MARLSQDLIQEILLGLPVKSLLRFRGLSKSSCALIDTPDFVNSNLTRSSKKFNRHKLIFEDCKKFRVCDVNADFGREILLLGEPVSYLWEKVCGYSNGLLLLERKSFGFSLWNPSTHKFRDLPVCPFKKPADVRTISITGLGLGYDDSINDYKALCIVSVQRKFQDDSEVQVWVYRLKSNNWKRALDFPYLNYRMEVGNCCFCQPQIGCFTDSSLYWLCYKGSKDDDIVAFDVIKDTFYIVPQPICRINSANGAKSKLHVQEGRLFISYFKAFEPLHAYLYMRKKVGVDQFSWIKLFSLSKHILGRTVGKFSL